MSLRTKIMGIAMMLIVLMTITAIISTTLVAQGERHIDGVVNAYIPAYANLARANTRSLERALALRIMVIQKLRPESGNGAFDAAVATYESKGKEVEAETAAARALIKEQISKAASPGEAAELARLDSRIEAAIGDTRRRLSDEQERLIRALDLGDAQVIDDAMGRVDGLRDELNQKLDSIRADMRTILEANAASIKNRQAIVIVVSAFLTLVAIVLGGVFSLILSNRLISPIQLLLVGARAVAAGQLDQNLAAQSRDEIGRLTEAFNNMVTQLREKETLRKTFGKYVDPRVINALMSRPDSAREGQRRVMTVMFCDIMGFTHASEQMTPQGLVKVMNRYFSAMTEVIHRHGGVVDKYIGDAIMAFWGSPFVDDADQARLASLAALDMLASLPSLRAEFPELLGLRELPFSFDIRIGIATGEVLVGSIGSEIMMSYTVLGDTVNLASRLEGVNRHYGSHILAAEATVKAAADAIDAREIDRVVVLGQTKVQPIFEIMGIKGNLSLGQSELHKCFSVGLAAYRAQHWDGARRAFAAALEAVPGDGPSMTFSKRVDQMEVAPPGAEWDGAWHFEKK
jgi:class 3 adenylate cyclase